MNAPKNFFVGLLVALVLNLATVAHAEVVDPYFSWKIKNADAYKYHELLFKATGLDDIEIKQYDWSPSNGDYSVSLKTLELVEAQQKIAFGMDYFDEGLVELSAKYYLMTDEFDKAERRANFLLENAQDNSIKIRALNLKSDLLNRRENYREALQITQEVDELLKSMPDENLNLINQSRAAKAYCGLGEAQKSLELAEKIFPQMQNTFGIAGMETLALMSTLAEDYRKLQRYEDSEKILIDKVAIVDVYYEEKDPVLLGKNLLEFADLCLENGYSKYGNELLGRVIDMAIDCFNNKNNYNASLQLYKAIKEIAIKYPVNPGNEDLILLESEMGLALSNYKIGNVQQSLEISKRNLPAFKRVFGEYSDENFALRDNLSNCYFNIGRYSDAKKVIEETANIFSKNDGEYNTGDVINKIDLAEIYYRMGKYKTADKLLEDVEINAKDILENDKKLNFSFLLIKAIGARMKGDYDNYGKFLGKSHNIAEELNKYKTYVLFQEINLFQKVGLFVDVNKLVNLQSLSFLESLDILDKMNSFAEYYVFTYNLKDAEKFSQQALELSRKNLGENNIQEWRALNTMSKIRRAESKFTDALELDRQALQIAEKVCGKKSLERMQSLDAIASDYTAQGNFNEAIRIRERALAEYEKILEGDGEITIQMTANLAENYLSMGRYNDAMKLCDKMLPDWENLMSNTGKLLLYFNEDIIKLFKTKATIQRLSGDNINANETYKKIVFIHEVKRKINNEDAISNEMKSRWFAKAIPVYREAATVAVSEEINDKEKAFYYTEFCKGRNLIEHYDDILVAKNYLISDDEKKLLSEYEKLINSCNAVSEHAAAIGDETLRLNAESIYTLLNINNLNLREKLRKKYTDDKMPKVSQRKDETKDKLDDPEKLFENILKSFDVKKNQRAIPNGACFIEFMKTDDSLVVTFLQNEGDVQAVNIPVDKKFFDDCLFYHDLNAYSDIKSMNKDIKYLWNDNGEYVISENRVHQNPDAFSLKYDNPEHNAKFYELREKLSAELSEKLMPTLEKFAGTCSHWIISPDAELNLIPFETLAYHDKFLVESKDVSYVPSLAVLNLMKNREKKNSYLRQSKELLAMGDAIYGDNDTSTSRESQRNFLSMLRGNPNEKIDLKTLLWQELEGTALELDNVSALFENKTVLRREEASEKKLRELNTKVRRCGQRSYCTGYS